MGRRLLASMATTAGLVAGLAVAAQPASAATPDCSSYPDVRTGTIAEGQTLAPWQYYLVFEDSVVELCLDGPDGADIDLKLNSLAGTETDGHLVATAPAGGSDKTLTYEGPSWTAYKPFLTANSGSGTYTIGIRLS